MRVAPNIPACALQVVRDDAGSIYDKLGHANVYMHIGPPVRPANDALWRRRFSTHWPLSE